ncbi:MAG: transcription-repair coupling factor [Bacillota bacterium]|nr:transcription-repair coupling factor [Bacillota bacterium]
MPAERPAAPVAAATPVAAAERDPQVAAIARLWPARHVNVTGPVDAQKACLLMAAAGRLGRPLLLVVADELAARRLAEALAAFAPEPEGVAVWPRRELELGRAEAASREQEQARLALLRRLAAGELQTLVVPAAAALIRLPDPRRLATASLRISHDGEADVDELCRKLEALGYERAGQARLAGQFARRGDILDIVPVGLPENRGVEGAEDTDGIGYRISFFDTQIDQLKSYSLQTQRSLENLEHILVTAARERLIDPQERTALTERVRAAGEAELLELRRHQVDPTVTDRLQRLLERDLADLTDGHDSPGLDKWLSFIHGDDTILDHGRHHGCLFAVDEPQRVSQRLDQAQAEHAAHVTQLLTRGQTFAGATEARLGRSDIMSWLDRETNVLSLAMIGSAGSGFPDAIHLNIQGRESEGYRGRDAQLVELVRQRQHDGLETWFLTQSPERAQRLGEILLEHGVTTPPQVSARSLARGFEWPRAGLLVFGSEDVFGQERRQRRRRFRGQGLAIDFFSDLRPGELVVHENYGIGLYEGLVNQSDSQGTRRDYLAIRYAGDDRLFLPMEQLDQIQRHIGGGSGGSGGSATGSASTAGTDDTDTPGSTRLTRLGTLEWTRAKERARASIRRLAVDLVKLYARRSVLRGHAFQAETVWDREFAASFPYEETPDQLRVIDEVTADMESDGVMDRLLCGDVGFGKTEVAFRAIFKCVGDSRQAALLAPTTVLAQQHYDTFLERLGDFPLKVGLLSRFVPAARQRQVLRGLAAGTIDVVIGTHRILSQDVSFKRLGLLVVDEEQRFGVNHKERIKALTPSVDVLSLSATPIPRTLHMSLSGIRDISVLEEAPEDRRPVQTYVMEYDSGVIEEAILRELGRQGQVFYLFNDTRRIAERAQALGKALPGARVIYAHGRMAERELEDVIRSFISGEADILVCTTIIESGIDMPNVNTIIVERAERLGLAQLYQLRGRVGRSHRQAYAYITYRRDQVLSEIAEKRLAAIRDFTELGAGFRIAMRDLEVRGAGNLLGAEQHGQMEAIGYDLYTRMLSEEVEKAKHEAKAASPTAPAVDPLIDPDPTARVDCVVELALDSYIPSSYIPDEGERMDMYRRIGAIQDAAAYRDVLDELHDRYGDPPAACLTLCDVALARQSAGSLGISRIHVRGADLRLELATASRPDMAKLLALPNLDGWRGRIRFSAGQRPHVLLIGAADPLSGAPALLGRLFLDLEARLRQEAAALSG